MAKSNKMIYYFGKSKTDGAGDMKPCWVVKALTWRP